MELNLWWFTAVTYLKIGIETEINKDASDNILIAKW